MKAKKYRPDDPDDFDEDFSDDDTAEYDNIPFNEKKKDDDSSDTISIKSDEIIDEEEPTSPSFEKKGSIRIKKSLKHSVDFFKKQKKDESIKETLKETQKETPMTLKTNII